MTERKAAGLSLSCENYLESIYRLSRTGESVRPVDIANDLEVSRPSVTRALQALAEQGLILRNACGAVRLTEDGTEAAESILARCSVLKEFFSRTIGGDHMLSDRETHGISFSISSQTVDAIRSYLQGASLRAAAKPGPKAPLFAARPSLFNPTHTDVQTENRRGIFVSPAAVFRLPGTVSAEACPIFSGLPPRGLFEKNIDNPERKEYYI